MVLSSDVLFELVLLFIRMLYWVCIVDLINVLIFVFMVFRLSRFFGLSGFFWNLWIDIIGFLRVSGGMIMLMWLLLGRCVLIIGFDLFNCCLIGVRMWCMMCSRWLLLVKCIGMCLRML